MIGSGSEKRELKKRRQRQQRERQKNNRLDLQNNNLARASRFFVRFLTVVALLQRESAYFHVLSRTGTQDNNFLFLFPNFDTVFQKSTTKKNCPHV